jgi:hypothetical protein
MGPERDLNIENVEKCGRVCHFYTEAMQQFRNETNVGICEIFLNSKDT